MDKIRGKWSQAEYDDRLKMVRVIVEGAAGIQNPGKYLDEETLAKRTKQWEIALDGVATQHLSDLYHVGMAKKCTSAADFENVWHASVIAKHEERENRAFLRHLEEQNTHRAITPAVARQKAAEWRARAAAHRKVA